MCWARCRITRKVSPSGEKILVSKIDSALERFRQSPTRDHPGNPFRLVSSVAPPAEHREVESAWRALPADLEDFWAACRSARLFEDAGFGQWGLVLLDPQTSKRRTIKERTSRPDEFRADNVVIGAFLGDQELLVMAPSESGPRRILIVLPLDPRDAWFGAASGLARFLDAYFDAGGAKYWER